VGDPWSLGLKQIGTNKLEDKEYICYRSGAYRTAPTKGVQGITGLLPLDLQIQWEGTRHEVKRRSLTQEEQGEIRNKIIET